MENLVSLKIFRKNNASPKLSYHLWTNTFLLKADKCKLFTTESILCYHQGCVYKYMNKVILYFRLNIIHSYIIFNLTDRFWAM